MIKIFLRPCVLNATPDQNVYHARTHFLEERGNFSKVGANSRNQEKGVIFQTKFGEILK